MLYEAAALVLAIGYSVRNAFIGEMDAARRAGITAAKNAETVRAMAAMPRAALKFVIGTAMVIDGGQTIQ